MADNYSTKELKALGVDDVNTFNVRDHFNALGAPVGGNIREWQGSPLVPIYSDAMLHACAVFFEKLRVRVKERTGRDIPWSLNGIGPWNELDRAFDFRIGEFQYHFNQPQTILTLTENARREGKFQAYVAMVNRNWETDPDFVPDTRLNIATGYALGGLPLVPWCMYMHDAPRYYGKVEDFGDLFHFISRHRDLFDEYQTTACAGMDTQAKLYSWLPNQELHLDGQTESLWVNKDNVFAVLRRNPDREHAVIHLVDWNDDPAGFELAFSPKSIVGTDAVKLTIMRPEKDDLVIESYPGGTINIPSLSPWGLIAVTPSTQPTKGVPAPHLTAPARSAVPRGTKIEFELPVAGHSIAYRFVAAGADAPAEFAAYDPANPPILDGAGVLEAYTRDDSGDARSETLRVRFGVFDDFAIDAGKTESPKGLAIEDRFKVAGAAEVKINGGLLTDRPTLLGEPVEHGISVCGEGATHLVCDVEPEWETFTVDVGIDDAEARRPAARFQVWFDDELAYETPILNPLKTVILDSERRAFNIHLRIPEGASKLRLTSVPGGFFPEHNTVVWSNPIASRTR